MFSGEMRETTTDKITIERKGKLLETHNVYDDEDNPYIMCIYGLDKPNDPFNQYEFQCCNPRGVVYAILLDNEGHIYDLTIEMFKDIYEEEEILDDMIEEDELGKDGEDSYDYDDDFIDND
jgi:hypothetical protein